MAHRRFLERTTRRLVVRPLRASDYRAWKIGVLEQGPPRNRWDTTVPRPSLLTRDAFRQILARYDEESDAGLSYRFGVFRKGTGEFIGFLVLMDITRRTFNNAYLGWHILTPHWGQGYGTEAVRALVRIALEDLALHRVEAAVDPGNRRSLRLARRVGLRPEGTSRRRLRVRGEWRDMRLFALTCEELGIRWSVAREVKAAAQASRAVRKRRRAPKG